MKKKRIIGAVVWAGIAISIALLFFYFSDPNLDARSGATFLQGSQKLILPPAGEGGVVLGELSGVRGFVVQYDDLVFRGGEPYKKSAAKTLQKLGVKTIVSIVPTEGERAFCRKFGFALVELPFDKITGVSPADVALLRETMTTEAAPFYFHCKGGSHRGGTLSAAYRLFVQDWSYEKAMGEFDRLGGDPQVDQNLMESLRRMVPASEP